ncbi:hypothetical protein KUTeg_004021 [Tegillarca granosa]|uniref:YqaJ viral recombinase domain-containing protein n=1 Tax=Tegillarca granosa TaxID=220873 RepID=A0ABQ9FT96_TEGGR|nr:hypothetical protein KUTeg_004021 [Tegillarca granosa]
MTIKDYKLRKQEEKDPVTVEGVGLVIDKDEKYLAVSPDGIVKCSNGELGLIEVKNLLHNKQINLYQAAHGKEFCLELLNNELHLKKSHGYFFQVQGQLNICNMSWVDFVVRTEKPYQLHIERIKKDKNLWNNQMLPKLKAFNFNAVLPELVYPTVNTISGIREPGQWKGYTEVPPGRVEKEKRKKCRKNLYLYQRLLNFFPILKTKVCGKDRVVLHSENN